MGLVIGALLYRRADVQPGQLTLLEPGKSGMYWSGYGPVNSASLRTLPEIHKVAIKLPDTLELDWDYSQTGVGDTNMTGLYVTGDEIISDTAEIRRNWRYGYQTVDTPRTQFAQGWLSGQSIVLTDTQFDVSTAKATVAFSSMEDAALTESSEILFTACARAEPTAGSLPFYTEPVLGTFKLKRSDTVYLYPLSGDGQSGSPVTLTPSNGWVSFTLSGTENTHWFMLKP